MTEQEKAFETWWDKATEANPQGLIDIPDLFDAWKAALEWAAQGQEPVAWRVWRSKNDYELFFDKTNADRRGECFIPRRNPEPLYTHPAAGCE